jgi:hypothetical protein
MKISQLLKKIQIGDSTGFDWKLEINGDLTIRVVLPK